jgi:hypothetical protein
MIRYYLRPDLAVIRIDDENKIATNVLTIGDHKFIGHITNPNYVDSMLEMLDRFTQIEEQQFNEALQEAKQFILNLS